MLLPILKALAQCPRSIHSALYFKSVCAIVLLEAKSDYVIDLRSPSSPIIVATVVSLYFNYCLHFFALYIISQNIKLMWDILLCYI